MYNVRYKPCFFYNSHVFLTHQWRLGVWTGDEDCLTSTDTWSPQPPEQVGRQYSPLNFFFPLYSVMKIIWEATLFLTLSLLHISTQSFSMCTPASNLSHTLLSLLSHPSLASLTHFLFSFFLFRSLTHAHTHTHNVQLTISVSISNGTSAVNAILFAQAFTTRAPVPGVLFALFIYFSLCIAF